MEELIAFLFIAGLGYLLWWSGKSSGQRQVQQTPGGPPEPENWVDPRHILRTAGYILGGPMTPEQFFARLENKLKELDLGYRFSHYRMTSFADCETAADQDYLAVGFTHFALLVAAVPHGNHLYVASHLTHDEPQKFGLEDDLRGCDRFRPSICWHDAAGAFHHSVHLCIEELQGITNKGMTRERDIGFGSWKPEAPSSD